MNIAVELVRTVARLERSKHEDAIRRAVFEHKDIKAVAREIEIFGDVALANCLHTAYRGTVQAVHNVPVHFALKFDGYSWNVLAACPTRQHAWKALQQ